MVAQTQREALNTSVTKGMESTRMGMKPLNHIGFLIVLSFYLGHAKPYYYRAIPPYQL